MNSRQIAFFDFDGTITKKDSFIDFIQYVHGIPRFFSGLLRKSPYLLGYKTGLYPNYRAKEHVLSHFFSGMDYTAFQKIAQKYSRERLPSLVIDSALNKIRYHKFQRHVIVIVSASISDYLRHWCDSEGIALISSELEIVDQKITGKLSGKNCYGAEKVARIRLAYNLDRYDCIHAYGNSRGDKEMLALADVSHYRVFC